MAQHYEHTTDDMMLNARSPDADGNVRRNLSETQLNQENNFDKFDSYHLLERSQSEIALLKDMSEEEHAVEKQFSLSSSQACDSKLFNETPLVSESSKVYFDLSNIGSGDDEDYRKTRSRISSSSSMKQSLETIPQNEELKFRDAPDDEKCGICREDMSLSLNVDSIDQTTKIPTQKCDVKNKAMMKSALTQTSAIMKTKVQAMISSDLPEKLTIMREIEDMIDRAWSTPIYGRDLAYGLCDTIREEEGLNFLIHSLKTDTQPFLQECTKLIDQILTTHNRDAVVKHGLDELIEMTVVHKSSPELSCTITGILESLFKHSESTCSHIIRLGGLDTLLYWCRCSDATTLRHCAVGLANLSLYGGPDNQLEMIKRNTSEWLFPLAFSSDTSVRYYACLAISTLAANKEIQSSVLQSGTMELVGPFIATHSPDDFAQSDKAHIHGRSPGWIMRLIPLLLSRQEEAQTLAAFHLAMEAGIKKEQQKTQLFYDIEAIEPLRKVASSTNALASKLAAETLLILGEDLPHKLSPQVPLWSVEDVVIWVKQIGYAEYSAAFAHCRVDGDLLLLTSDTNLHDSIHMKQSLLRKRFLRELKDLKIQADYSSCDLSKLNDWLREISTEFSFYIYPMLQVGIDTYNLSLLTDSILRDECNINYAIHRHRILTAATERSVINEREGSHTSVHSDSSSKPIDVFISYRRSNGSQLASLLKVHLQLRGFSVFLDIEALRAGKFDEGLLQSVRTAKHFILVLTENSLDRCVNDGAIKDWMHKEVTAALECGANIIPIIDHFQWPKPDTLPDDMRSVCYFNAIRWIHDYQDACVDKVESFLRGEINTRRQTPLTGGGGDLPFHGNNVDEVFQEETIV